MSLGGLAHLRLGLFALRCRLAVAVVSRVVGFEFHALDIFLHVLGHLGHYPAANAAGVSLQPPSSLTSPGPSLIQSLGFGRGRRADRSAGASEPDKTQKGVLGGISSSWALTHLWGAGAMTSGM